jgi:hypothetical protein
MQQRLETLRRLVNLYAVVEDMHLMDLQRMTATVREAEQAIVAELDVAKSARMGGREALIAEDRAGWLMSEIQQATAGWRRQRLEQIRLQREHLNYEARRQYMESRLKREQMKSVFDEIATRTEIEEGRRTQTASDDRFLARRRWTNAKQEIRVNEEMKTS